MLCLQRREEKERGVLMEVGGGAAETKRKGREGVDRMTKSLEKCDSVLTGFPKNLFFFFFSIKQRHAYKFTCNRRTCG